MQQKIVSRTALGTTMGRALESYRPEEVRLFEDRFAMGFLPLMYRALVRLLNVPVVGAFLLAKREQQVPGIMGNLLCRTRFIDDALRDALAKGIEQLAILGAGFDSRAYRISGASRTRVFEVDHPATQAWKRKRLKRTHHEFLQHVTFVPVDLERQKLAEELAAAGFRSDARTLFIWEGVTQYISDEAVDSTFRYVSSAAAPESRIVFTYIHRETINGSVPNKGVQKLLLEIKRQGEPWIFGIDPDALPQYLSARGLKLVEETAAADYRKRYLEPMGRMMDIFDGERVAVAEVTGAKADRA